MSDIVRIAAGTHKAAETVTMSGIVQGLAKVLGIKLQNQNAENLTRGESVYSISSADTYIEREPTTAEWLRHVFPTSRDLLSWAYSLFPFVHWIDRYNVQWLYGDLVAGGSLYLCL